MKNVCFMKKFNVTWRNQVKFHVFMNNVFFISSHLRPVLKEFRGAPEGRTLGRTLGAYLRGVP